MTPLLATKLIQDFKSWSGGAEPQQYSLDQLREYARSCERPEEAWDLLYELHCGKRPMFETIEDARYESLDGWVMVRECGYVYGNPFADPWVLRTVEGVVIDNNQYRNDLASAHKLYFYHMD